MSLKSPVNNNSLEVTGNLLELPPCKEATKSIEKKLLSIKSGSKQRQPLVQLARSISTSRMLNTPGSAAPAKSMPTNKSNEFQSPSDLFTNVKDHQLKSYDIYLDEIKSLKKRIEDLECQLKLSQKLNKDKDKLVEELNKKFTLILKQEKELNDKILEIQEMSESVRVENENLKNRLKLKDENIRDLLNSVDKSKNDITKIRLEHSNELKRLNNVHGEEIKIRDEKLTMLKKQIAGAFKDNSWERQLQIDELTKELKRTQDEYELLRHKLVGLKNKNGDSCLNCPIMLEKLEQKTVSIKEQELLLTELMNIIKKFQSQSNINLQDDLLRITANRKNSDLLFKLNINPSQNQSLSQQQKQQTQSQSNQSAVNKTKIKNRLI